ncbi:MAG: Gfo/Idh/MocA family oxidoreductase [Candidatus Hydrogenedentes bacterium]|nr:Gfo/Idh/MocA family oxidoreductase [Candidatus Hydrogenedentota bacterium]
MDKDLSRRNFFKATGATAGLAIAAGWSPFSYAQNEKVRVALIGTGSQNCVHIEDGLAGAQEIDIVAIADCLIPNLGKGFNLICGDDEAKKAALKPHLYLDYHEMLDKEKDNIDAVIIATPFKTHYKIVMDCLDAGKYVFCEKTMAHTYEYCRNIVTKCHETGLFVQCGHQRRYNPEFNRAATDIIERGRLGRVSYIEAQWHRNGDWRRPLPLRKDGTAYQLTEAEQKFIPNFERHMNWRIYEEFSAGLMSELATHHLEVTNFLMGTMPTRVHGTGGIDYWRDGRDTYDNVALTYEYEMNSRLHGFGPLDARNAEMQNHMREINRPYTVRVTWTGTLQSAYKGAYMLVIGDKGTFQLRERTAADMPGCVFCAEPKKIYLDPKTGQPTEDKATIEWIRSSGQSQKYTRLEDVPPVPFESELGMGIFDKTPDTRQFEAFAKHIKEGGKPRTNEMVGLMASICDIAGHEAVTEKKTVEIDPALYAFDFETPNPFEYESI